MNSPSIGSKQVKNITNHLKDYIWAIYSAVLIIAPFFMSDQGGPLKPRSRKLHSYCAALVAAGHRSYRQELCGFCSSLIALLSCNILTLIIVVTWPATSTMPKLMSIYCNGNCLWLKKRVIFHYTKGKMRST